MCRIRILTEKLYGPGPIWACKPGRGMGTPKVVCPLQDGKSRERVLVIGPGESASLLPYRNEGPKLPRYMLFVMTLIIAWLLLG